jgi:S1-C subfamily serine protease
VGITYSVEGRTDNDGRLIFSEYPVVVSVDPGSPAARGGIVAGDTIIAFNDRDVRRFAFPVRTMIQPGRQFVIRARRGSQNRVTKLIVAERPSDRPEKFEIAIAETPEMPLGPFVLTPGPRPMIRIATSSPHGLTAASVPLAGAEIRALNADFAKSLGIKPQGLLIVDVADGTPAKNSGLRGGDVLLRAAGTALLVPQDLRREIESCLDKELRLDIVREKKARVVILKW